MKETPMTPTRRTVLLAALGGGISLFSQGCGGGGAGTRATGTGSATFKLTWPEATRLIPQASTSIKIQVLDGTKVIKTVVLQRPATEITIKELPAKKLTNLVQAFPNADATGIAQAQVRAEVEIKADETVKVSLTMASTIERMEPSAGGLTLLEIDQKAALSATPRNAAGEAILIKAGTLRWTSSAPEVASVTDTGEVLGLRYGDALVRATEPESGKQTEFAVRVAPREGLIYTQIASNVTGTTFASLGGKVRVYDFTDFDDVPIAHLGFVTEDNQTEVDRLFRIILPPSPSAGQRFMIGTNVRGGQANTEHLEVRRVLEGNQIRRKERRFWGFVSGSVTVTKVEGRTYTLLLEGVRMDATDVDQSDATGSFVADGTLVFVDMR